MNREVGRMFEKLKNRYYFTGKIVLLNELHIGSGRGNVDTDALVITGHDNKPFIPGSSLRGALRSTIERIASAMRLNPCLLIDSNSCVSTSRELQKEFRELPPAEVIPFLTNPGKVCHVCRLFGSTVVSSKIRITDLILSNGGKCAIRDGVAIDRDTGAAKAHAKFDFETVSRDSKFQFEIIGENLEPKDLGLLALGIQELIDGNFWLGGNTARGLGKCKLEDLEIKYFEGADGLKNYLLNKTLSSITPANNFLSYINYLFPAEAKHA
jgi:CRISPR-associated RAMP protein (TIGR02581 family)